MKEGSYVIFFLLVISILGCGSSSSDNSSQSVGADAIQKFGLVTAGQPVIIPMTLPQQFTDANWNLKEGLCQRAGYDLAPYAGQNVSLIKYNLIERYNYNITLVSADGLPTTANGNLALYLWVIVKDQATICSYTSVAEDSTTYQQLHQIGVFPSEFFAVNDEHIK